MWFLYIVRSADSSLYTGISKDVARRFEEHSLQSKKCAKYLRGRDPLKLVFTMEAGTKSEASRKELLLKRAPKSDKELLVKGLKSFADLGLL